MKGTKQLEKKDLVFCYAPVVEDIALEYGVDDPLTITCMYELFKRVTGFEKQYTEDDDAYKEGYKNGFNDAIELAGREIDDAAWNIGRLKKV